MDEKIRRVYVPMTETGFYILFSLQEERHGYHVIQYVKKITDNEIIISAGTLYGTLSKMETDQVYKRGRKKKILSNYRAWQYGTAAGAGPY